MKHVKIINRNEPNEIAYSYDYNDTITRRCECGHVIKMHESDIGSTKCPGCTKRYMVYCGSIVTTHDYSAMFYADED